MLRGIYRCIREEVELRIYGQTETCVIDREGTRRIITYTTEKFNEERVNRFNQDVAAIGAAFKKKTEESKSNKK